MRQLENVSLIRGPMGLLATFHWGQERKQIEAPWFSDSQNNRLEEHAQAGIYTEPQWLEGGWSRAVPDKQQRATERGEKTAGKSQEPMRNRKAIAVQAYGEGSKRRHAVPGQKASWRGALGCGDDSSWLSLGCPGSKTVHAVSQEDSQDPKYWQLLCVKRGNVICVLQ